MAARAIPEGFNSVSAYLVVNDAEAAMAFYGRAFGAVPGDVLRMPDSNAVMHAELRIGNSSVMLSQENPDWDAKSALTLGGSPVSLHLYVEDVDSAFKQAVDAGCEVVFPVMDAFWGDRYGKLKDPFGLQWGIATHVEDLTQEQIAKRAAEWFASMQQPG